ncbi:LysR family transcriptional regulator [Rhizobium lentis]|nr:LysR family transcriptional regulator [Rhizobium lentis]MBX5000408.1 LysR family transcriptional regulator [Rhizobium lentis]MBX5018768.1 LysR family transcriptional regulator [Rhizobium lentis]MBX5042360.1 LysR family transcriptional regulator [Rhizobium lentis]MBX5054258.1 LysR family transcriptional regulator [Rhizobium lentis]MBX5071156.1 LysR family transcriptional regulator [Rhizobium lentis]
MVRAVSAGISLKHIEAFDAIAATGSTIAAALELGISQSNTSRLLQQLEDYLGFRLFEHDKNRLSPTREGRRLGPDIRAISDRLRELKTAAVKLESGHSREMLLRLAFPASLSSTVLPRMIKAFFGAHGSMRVELASGSYFAIERMVAEADIGFARLPLATPGLRQEKQLFSPVTYCLVSGEKYPLAKSAGLFLGSIADWRWAAGAEDVSR